MTTDHIIYVYAGSSDRPHAPETIAAHGNKIRLGGIYGAGIQRYAVAVEVPDEILSPAARRMVRLMDGDFTGGPVRLGEPRMMIRRRRIGIDEAAVILGYPPRAAQCWIEAHGGGVGNAVVREDVADGVYPKAQSTAELARQLNRLASRAGLVIVMPDGQEMVVDEKAASIDETVQAHRWKHLLDRARRIDPASRAAAAA